MARLRELRAVRYSSSREKWRHTRHGDSGAAEPLPSSVVFVTWNVNFNEDGVEGRLAATLSYIQHKLMPCKTGERPKPCCILLQEIHADAFHVILENDWIREYFIITPPSADKFPPASSYGCVTLVSRSIPVVNIRSLEFESPMARNALMVDLKLSVPGEHSRVVTFRVVNTHLESLIEGAEARRVQMTLIARYITEDELYGGIVGGDMNAVQQSDASIPESVGLEDAWKAKVEKKKRKSFGIWGKSKSSKSAGEDKGFTWGFQPPSDDKAPGRLDKILFLPKPGYQVEEPQVVGQGEKTDEGEWLSDHFGLLTTVHVVAEEPVPVEDD